MRKASRQERRRLLGVAAIGSVTVSCERERAESTPPAPSAVSSVTAMKGRGFAHVELAFDADVDESVALHARDAYEQGLLPVVHSRTPWNSAPTLGRNLADPLVSAALDGIYLIEIEYDDTCVGQNHKQAVCNNEWSKLMCGTYANMLMVAGPNGEKTRKAGSPGKSGPTTPAQNARMIRSFRKVVEEVERGGNIGNCAFLEHDDP